MSGWASILSVASALLGTLAGFWATARKLSLIHISEPTRH